jgi:hypothetical protein
VLQQLVKALVKTVLFGEREVAVQQIRNRAVIEPMPVQPPFGTWINEPIEHQCLQHLA